MESEKLIYGNSVQNTTLDHYIELELVVLIASLQLSAAKVLQQDVKGVNRFHMPHAVCR